MKLDGSSDQAQLNSMLYHDNSALANIKHSRDQEGALEMVAGQFEAMFLQLVLRQMRSSSDVLADKDSPFSSKQQGVFRDMYDGQLAMELAKKTKLWHRQYADSAAEPFNARSGLRFGAQCVFCK